MAKAALLSDQCSGHSCWPSRPNITASSDVIINGRGAQRVGDQYVVHCCPDSGCHPGAVIQGSSTVFVNGRAVARIGDALDCGSIIMGPGSSNVDIG